MALSVVRFSLPGHRLRCARVDVDVDVSGWVRTCVRGRARMRVAGMRVMTRRALRDRLVVQGRRLGVCSARELLWKD